MGVRVVWLSLQQSRIERPRLYDHAAPVEGHRLLQQIVSLWHRSRQFKAACVAQQSQRRR
jgi:hypothetical protein